MERPDPPGDAGDTGNQRMNLIEKVLVVSTLESRRLNAIGVTQHNETRDLTAFQNMTIEEIAEHVPLNSTI